MAGRVSVPAPEPADPTSAMADPAPAMADLPDPVAAARRFVEQRGFPGLRAAFVAGSVLTRHRTPTSDLDIVVLLAGPPAPFRENLRHDGWPVELFVQTEADWHRFADQELADGRSPLLHMCAQGLLLADVDGLGATLQSLARQRLAAGPPSATTAELDRRRYEITDALDDLRGAADLAERLYLATQLLHKASELALRAEGRWLGGGKWLSRRLGAADPALHHALTSAVTAVATDAPDGTQRLVAAVEQALSLAGGPLWAGYTLGRPDS
ncbi:hypothetical protein ABH931_006513 [Streptacidiphilus sp. MAP12-33]|uniref:nucleotidyltransferase domain-containing protein n=1 Tax=Streptacidiphilus sp. MAP12-33 TaxID=3156266 RepID=UPI0035130F20